MLEQLSFQNIRGNSRDLALHARTCLSGHNGAGKTSVADAIAFLYTGCDLRGTPLPVHLISHGGDKMSVTGNTGKVEISRTLTAKKSTVLKMTKDGITNTYTQSKFEEMTCSRDMFLSAFVAGYFMSLSNEKRLKVLEEAFPKVDKLALLEHTIEHKLTEDEARLIDLSKRADLAVTKLVEARRLATNELTSISMADDLLRNTPAPGDAPPTPDCNAAASLRQLRRDWVSYRESLSSYEFKVASYASYEADRKKIASAIESLKLKLESFPEKAPPEAPADVNSAVMALADSRKPLPGHCVTQAIVESDRCPACAQVVPPKHRESIKKQNADIRAEYDKKLTEVEAHNKEVDANIAVLVAESKAKRSAYLAELNDYTLYCKDRQSLLNQISSLESALKTPPLEALIPPIPPSQPEPTKEDVEATELAYKVGVESRARWDQQRISYEQAQQLLGRRAARAEELRVWVSRLEALELGVEKTFESLSQRNARLFGFRDFTFEVSDSAITIRDTRGMTYDQFSTGEKIWCDACISEKLAPFCRVKFIFVDNADLVDKPMHLNVEQVIIASVEKGSGFAVTAF